MAYEFEDPKDEEQQLDENGQPISGTSGGLLTGAPGQGSAAGPTTSGDGFGSPQSKGFSGFTDINAYLDANRDQTADLSKKVAGKLTEEEQSVRSGIGKAGQDAEAAINAAAVRPDEGLVTRAAEKPADFVKNQSDVDAFKKMRDANYSGPAGIDDEASATLKNQVSEAQRRAKGVDTEMGREELLRSLNPGATKGMFTLDNLLLGADPNSRQTLAAAASPFDSLTSYLDEVSGTAKGKADVARTDADAARNLVSSKFTGEGGAIPTFEKGLTDRLAARQAEEAAQIARIKRNLGGYQVWDQDQGDVGVDAETMQKLMAYSNALQNQYGVDPDLQAYIKTRAPEEAITRDTFANADDYANYSALASLAGIDPTFLDPNNAAKAGTAPTDLTDFDYAGLNSSVHNTLSAKDQYLLSQDPASLSDEDQKKWMAVAKRAGLKSRYGDGRLEWQPWGGFGAVSPDQLEYEEPVIGLGPGGGPPYLQPPGSSSGGTSPGGGRHFF